METSILFGADDCLTCNGKGWVTVQAEPKIVETCHECGGGYLHETVGN